MARVRSSRLAEPAHPGRWLLAAAACAVFVVAAVVVEMVAGAATATFEPPWVLRWVPLAWPQPVRVLWWLLVAGAAGGHRWLLDRSAGRQRWWLVALYAAPFAAFAGGVAAGAQWATFH